MGMDTETDWIELSRDCEAVVIPAGNPILLPQGTKAVVTQSLGGSFTLHVQGYGLMRISNRDADAIGREPEPAPAAAEPAAPRGE
ncbi:MAG: putative Fe-S cluster assembly protein SufT, partial [Alphaproteobacteria bacterium]